MRRRRATRSRPNPFLLRTLQKKDSLHPAQSPVDGTPFAKPLGQLFGVARFVVQAVRGATPVLVGGLCRGLRSNNRGRQNESDSRAYRKCCHQCGLLVRLGFGWVHGGLNSEERPFSIARGRPRLPKGLYVCAVRKGLFLSELTHSNIANSDVLQARLAAIVASSDDAIISKNLNGIVQSWNDSARRIF